jgi:hydroxymethylpyrimidine pyrophosphatase-like HAD family hydrolase
MRWIEYFADVNLKGMNKQLGIDKMLEHFGIPLECAMAFGDGGNDIPMLQHVPYGVAMGNANDAVKAAAWYVTGDVDEGGLVNALEKFGLLDD